MIGAEWRPPAGGVHSLSGQCHWQLCPSPPQRIGDFTGNLGAQSRRHNPATVENSGHVGKIPWKLGGNPACQEAGLIEPAKGPGGGLPLSPRPAMPILVGRTNLKQNQGPKVLESSRARGPLQCQSEHYNSRCASVHRVTLRSGQVRSGPVTVYYSAELEV